MSALLQELSEHESYTNYGICSTATLFTYDYLLTFHRERKLIWKSKWSYGKILFLVIRYTAALAIAAFLVGQFQNPGSQMSCKVLVYLILSCVLVVILCAEIMLALRTWALWNRDLTCGIIVGIAWCSVTVLTVTFVIICGISIIPDENAAFPGLAGCGSVMPTRSSNAIMMLWFSVAGYESLIFLLTVVRGLRSWYNLTPLISILCRDAFLASACLLTLTFTDASLSSGNSSEYYVPFMISIALYAITPCRIILNLREATMSVDGWDLATTTVQHTEEVVRSGQGREL